jgi:glycosyltransferase involved in cell wall biosynthesis
MVALAATRKKYVTAFAGRRDSYQLPLALHENGRIVKFITDAYDAGPWASLLKATGVRGLERRRCDELPDRFVDSRLRYELLERALQRVMQPSRAGVIADAWFARAAAMAANASGASAILYEFQAEVGFPLLRRRDQRRILFHFHPHPGWEHAILRADVRAYPEFAEVVAAGTRSNLTPRYSEHTRNAWRLADHVIVASSCTRNSLLHVGCPSDRITVVPYGRETIEAHPALVAAPEEDRPFLLWVGSGTPRKGLHHVCRAWERSGCAQDARLVVVARTMDRGMERHLGGAGIKWIGGLPRAELNWYYRHAHAFVMPSLSEGFGQVYLEAIAGGCPVIGTRNSVLPDLEAAQRWITYVEPADISSLADRIRTSLAGPAPSAAQRDEIARSVGEFTWERFRGGIEAVLARFD